jgi:hypothetical protein
MSEISGILKGAGVALERQAFDMFGAAVQDQVKGALGGIFGVPSSGPIAENDARAVVKTAQTGIWDPSRYAAALASGAGNLDPKGKFLFKVRFMISPAFVESAKRLNIDINVLNTDLTFIVKNIDLPKVQFEYEEVNMYNFKTKVLKSITNRELALSFYDDTGNRALNFVNLYMKLLRPITRLQQRPGKELQNHGFAFDNTMYGLDTGGRGILAGDRIDILDSITIEQFYLDRTSQNPIDSIKLNRFVCTNARFESFDISDQDYENGGAANMISINFGFDALNIETGRAGKEMNSPSLPGGDILAALEERVPDKIQRSQPIGPGASRNPFMDILSRQGGRLAQTAISSALRKTVGTGLAGQALSGAIGTLSGTLGTAASRTLAGIGSSTPQGIAISTPSPIKDNSTPSAQIPNLASQSPPNDLGDFLG